MRTAPPYIASPPIQPAPSSTCLLPRLPRPLQDLARSGQPPVVLLDCLRFLAVRGLNTPALFASPVDKRRLLALKEAYDAGHRAVRGSKAAKLDPRSVANLLLLWLGALPEPLFPPEFVPELLRTRGGRAERVAAVRGFLKRVSHLLCCGRVLDVQAGFILRSHPPKRGLPTNCDETSHTCQLVADRALHRGGAVPAV